MRRASPGPRIALALAALVAAPGARANGRFPFASYVVVGPGARSDVIALRTTFGLIVSLDGGATFHWACEEALGLVGTWDAPVAIGADGTVVVGRLDGVVETRDGCGYALNASAGTTTVLDLAADPSGRTVLGAQAGAGATNHVLRSDDDGATFAALGAGVTDATLETVEIAPSNAMRVYATATDEATRAPRLYRSDDGGSTLVRLATDLLGGTDAFVSAVDPSNADRLWVRSTVGDGTALLRSDDAGATFAMATTTRGAMLGFALSDDASRVWVGGLDDGLLRSDDGGQTFHAVWDGPVSCLRYHAGVLYACTDWTRTGYALWRWPDGASAPTPLLALADTMGPFACAAGTIEHDTCGARWPMQQMAVTVHARDAGASDAGSDAAGALDAGEGDAAAVMDAGLDGGAVDEGTVAPRSGCGCAVPGGRRSTVGAGWIALVLAAGASRRRRAQGC